MKDTFKYLLIVLSLTIYQDAFSQNNALNSFPQLLFPSFSTGKVLMKNGKSYSAILNYNTIEEEMLSQQGTIFVTLNRLEEIDTIFLNDEKFVPIDKKFYHVLVSGKIPFYIENRSHYTQVGSKTAYGMTSQTLGPTSVSTVRGGNQVRTLEVPDNVTVTRADMYWVTISGETKKFSNLKQLIKFFPEKENELKEFIKAKKLDFNKVEDIIILGNYCNSLD